MISGRLSARSLSDRVVSLIIESHSFIPNEAIRMQAVPPPTMKRAGMEMIPAIVPPFRIIPMMMKTQAPTRPMSGDMRGGSGGLGGQGCGEVAAHVDEPAVLHDRGHDVLDALEHQELAAVERLECVSGVASTVRMSSALSVISSPLRR